MSPFDNIAGTLTEFGARITKPILHIFGIEWERTVRRNFEVGGRPKWTPRKRISKKQKGRNILVISGALKNYKASTDGTNVVLVPDPRARDYAAIHNKGGVINIPARTQKFRKVKTESGKTRSVFASRRHKRFEEKQIKAYQIKMPKREQTNIPQEDIPRWVQAIKQFIKL